MKKYFKKFSIMFVMLLAIVGNGAIQNGSIANAATVGQQLKSPETGWARYDDANSNISYIGTGWYTGVNTDAQNGSLHANKSPGEVQFNFTGTKLRIISNADKITGFSDNIKITIDNTVIDNYSEDIQGQAEGMILLYENISLKNGEHSVTITKPNDGKYIEMDTIDIDSAGILKPYNENISSISLNKSTDELQVGQTDILVATTTPAGTGVIWSSSDSSIATVDNTGKVTAVKEGQATIKATINDGSNLSSSCTVNVTPQTISASGITLNKTTDSMVVAQTDNLIATVTPDNATNKNVTWSSSDQSIATVDSNGKITAIKAGTVTITATTQDGSNLSATCIVNVANQTISASGLTLNKTTDSMVVAQTDNLSATVTPDNATNKNVIWSSGDPSIATVDSNGVVTAIKEGTVTIKATTQDGSNLSAACTVIVTAPATTGGTTGTGGTTTNTSGNGTTNIVNTATAKGDNTNNASGGVSIIFNGVPDTQLSVVKTANVKSVWVGDTFTYTIVVTNTGLKTAKAVVINDSAPNHIQFTASGITTTQGTVDPSSTNSNIIVNVGDILPSGTVTITIPATVIL